MTDGSQQPERRRGRRRVINGFAWYRSLEELPEGGVVSEGLAHSCDLSREGIGLLIIEPLALGTRVFVEISSSSFKLSAVGRVVNCVEKIRGHHRVGITLEAVPPNDRLAMRTYLDD